MIVARPLAYCLATTLLVSCLNQSCAGDGGETEARPHDGEDTIVKQGVAEAISLGSNSEPAESESPIVDLFNRIRRVKRDRGRTRESTMKAARAVSRVASKIRNREGVSLDDQVDATREQLAALSFLSRFDKRSSDRRNELVQSLKQDSRPQLIRLAAIEEFKPRIRQIGTSTDQQRLQLIDDVKAFLSGDTFDEDAYLLGSALARGIDASGNKDLAASLYEDLADMMQQSSDSVIQARAAKMRGAAWRMRLPGNFMELSGTTTGGQPFNWQQYRGKVVLVEFWASWCRACRNAIPNRKRNLQLYGDKGFEIVGINLDRTLAACEKFVEGEQISWVNLISDKEDELGWDNPLATQFGISAIPAAILVDQNGIVVSIDASGEQLDDLLRQALGEPIVQDKGDGPTKEETASDESSSENSTGDRGA